MNVKCISGIIALIIGAVLIIFAIQSMARIGTAKKDVAGAREMLPDNAMGNMVGSRLSAKAGSYDVEVRWVLIGGIAFAVLGGALIFMSKKKRR